MYYLRVLSGGIIDLAGNPLDGNSTARSRPATGCLVETSPAGLNASNNTVFSLTPIPIGHASPKKPAKPPAKKTTTTVQHKPAKTTTKLPVGKIVNGRLVVSHF